MTLPMQIEEQDRGPKEERERVRKIRRKKKKRKKQIPCHAEGEATRGDEPKLVRVSQKKQFYRSAACGREPGTVGVGVLEIITGTGQENKTPARERLMAKIGLLSTKRHASLPSGRRILQTIDRWLRPLVKTAGKYFVARGLALWP